MSVPRTVLLFDPDAHPSSWNERMAPGEFAVHPSAAVEGPVRTGPACTIFDSLAEAEAFAREQVAARPTLRCRIYDHHGFIGQPLRELRGASYKAESEISARFRRWVGAILLLGGAALIAFDWLSGFARSWPAMVGSRLLLPGLILLVTELVLVLTARRKHHSHLPSLIL